MSKDAKNGLMFILHLEKCLELQSKHIGIILEVLTKKDQISKEEIDASVKVLSSIKDSQQIVLKALDIIKNSHYKLN